ncbi:MAG: hypothetical protein RBT22_02230 [Aliarcobacter sp.]|jgi:hypothetical protein|nr:hypothetical protein [Aliarcobacter sp.]
MQISSPSSTSLFDTLSENLLSKKTNETEGSSFDSLIEKKEDSSVIIHKETTENLVKDLMSLLKTGFTEQELKDIEEILKKLEALNKDKSSGKSDSLTDIENRIKQLQAHLKEAQEKATGRSARNLDTDTILNSEIKTYDSKENLNNIKDGSVLKENQLIVASASEQLRLLEQLKQTKK